MNHWDARAEALLARVRTSDQAPLGARSRVKASVAASVALSAAAGASASMVAAPTAFAKLPVAVKAASAVLPGAVASIAPTGPIALLAPMSVGLALGLSAISPSAVVIPSSPGASVASAPAPVRAKLALRPVARSIPEAVAANTEPDAAPSEILAPAVSVRTPGGPSSLTEEAEMLEHARLVLRQGDAVLALRWLDQHRRQFPRTVLFFEALAMRAVALCRLGRTDEGKQLLIRLEATVAGSGLLAQVRDACGVRADTKAESGAE